jgi:short-subunit dehydrogenase
MINLTGKTALITGASSGIGEEFAREMAGRGTNLILVARREDRLRALAEELAQAHGVRVDVFSKDLTESDAPQELFEEIEAQGLEVHALVNNAGFGTYGQFEVQDAEVESCEIALNVLALVQLTRWFSRPMLARREGLVVNIASTAGMVPVAYMATYSATKAFVVRFSEALWAEFEGRGVQVKVLCPGYTKTSFQSEFPEIPTVGKLVTAEQLVKDGMRALSDPKPIWIHGFQNRLLAFFSRFAPGGVVARSTEKTMRPPHLRTS